MIAIETESLLSLPEAASRLPGRAANGRTHPASLARWAQRGVRGVRLDTVRVGGHLFTSVEALDRFLAKLNDLDLRTSEGVRS